VEREKAIPLLRGGGKRGTKRTNGFLWTPNTSPQPGRLWPGEYERGRDKLGNYLHLTEGGREKKVAGAGRFLQDRTDHPASGSGGGPRKLPTKKPP